MFCHIWLMYRVFFKTGLKYENRQKWSYYKEWSIFNNLLKEQKKEDEVLLRNAQIRILQHFVISVRLRKQALFKGTDTINMKGWQAKLLWLLCYEAWITDITSHNARCSCCTTWRGTFMLNCPDSAIVLTYFCAENYKRSFFSNHHKLFVYLL